MKILYLAHRIPYPPNKGDKIRSFNEIKYLSNSHEIDLVCLADNLNDMQYQQDLNQYCRRVFVSPLNTTWAKLKGLTYVASGKPISVGYFYWNKLQQTVDQWLKQTDYDAIICFSSPMGEYIFRTPSLRHRFSNRASYISKPFIPNPQSAIRNPQLVMDFCDVDSDKWGQYAKLTRFPKSFIYTLENRRLADYERRIAEHFDHSVFVSQKEAEIFLKQNHHLTSISVIPNGVDYEFFAPAQRLKVKGSRFKGKTNSSKSALYPDPRSPVPVLLFTGAMNYHANVDGVTWFCEEILPGIKTNIPEVQLYIVGSNPNANVKALQNNNGVKVTGFVENTRPFYEKADICVIPLRMARGIQNKVLEAMSMEKAVVTTSQAIQGITAVNGEHLVVADEPKEFARVVVNLFNDTNRRLTLGTNARRFVKANYNWQTNMKRLEELLNTSS